MRRAAFRIGDGEIILRPTRPAEGVKTVQTRTNYYRAAPKVVKSLMAMEDARFGA